MQEHVVSSINMHFLFIVNTIAITKPEKAKMVENMLINMAQTGRLGPKVFI